MVAVECQTEQLRALITPRVHDALGCLLPYDDIFTSEAASYAISEISEHLVMRLTEGERIKRANRGYDIVAGAEKIEVKARFVGKYKADYVHFNFGAHSRLADVGYCLLWQAEKGERASLRFAVRAPMCLLAQISNKGAKTYFARPTVGQLQAALAKFS